MPTTSTMPSWLSHAIKALQSDDIDGYMAMYSPDAIHEFPFAPEGHVRSLVGRDAIKKYMQRLPEVMRFGTLTGIRVREAGDELIIEATGHHRTIPEDTPRNLGYVWFITSKDGKVSRIRDYMAPIGQTAHES